MTSEAPERIWTCNETRNIWIGEKQGDTVEYIRVDLAEPKVKPLAWGELDLASTPFGVYKLHKGYKLLNGIYALQFHGFTVGQFKEKEAAKAAAQADYERRIKEALE